MEKKKALIIAFNDLNNSGVPNVIYQTVCSLHDEYDFDIIVFGSNLYYINKLKELNINNINVFNFTEQKESSRIRKIISYYFQKKVYEKVKNLFAQNKYDVVHSFKEYNSWPFLKASKKFNISKRIVHSTVIHENSGNLLIRFLNKRNKRLTLKYATKFIGVSEQCCQNTFKEKKYTVIYNGYNENLFNKSVVNKLKNDDLILTQVATYNSNKNQLFSLSVFKELINFLPNAHLKLIGKETENGYLNQMMYYIKQNNLENNVDLINGEKGVGNHFYYTTFALLPSKKEGAGIVAIEAQACGIKVFASSSVSAEMNGGGLISLDLNKGPSFWAKAIFDEFNKNHNNRQTYDLKRFSKETFSTTIHSIYIN